MFNNVGISFKLEKSFVDVKKKDSYKNEAEISAINIVSFNSIAITVSFQEQYGKIVSSITEIFSEYFGYSMIELEKTNNISMLMPLFISHLHDFIVKSYIHKGSSLSPSNNNNNF